MKLVWNVYEENSGRIEVYNIFNHGGFSEYLKKLIKKKPTREEFEKQLDRELMYYFWCKVEYEITITGYPPYINKEDMDAMMDEADKHKREYGRYPYREHARLECAKKVDIYSQVKLNWDVFVDYVWRIFNNGN